MTVAALAMVACSKQTSTASGSFAPLASQFVGTETCGGCHRREASLWSESHHASAMLLAADDTIAADFNGIDFGDGNQNMTFYRADDEFGIQAPDARGVVRDFTVTHAFGIEPLQQYLIDFSNGRKQAFTVAWDTRSGADGGQRWFFLYPGDSVEGDDPLHWTGRFFNWNSMCAECHSTDLHKNYDLSADSYATTFAEISVGCEACHGPGSQHAADPSEPLPVTTGSNRNWIFSSDARIATLAPETSPNEEIGACAVCHSRRAQLTDDHAHGAPFLDGYRPALLDQGLYHADGQILDEVYVYGSFLQSAMHAAGVTCSDCHEPHSASLRAEGDALCARCHAPEEFAAPAHHRHEAGDAPPQCVDCHMRSETYMVVDPRRDHSFRVPRPDLSSRIGSPNACNECHVDESAEWAADRVAEWFPQGQHSESHYGDALHAGRQWQADHVERLLELVDDRDAPAIVRATALDLLGRQIDDRVIERIDAAGNSPEPLLRLTAAERSGALPAPTQRRIAAPLLADPLRAVRIAAASSLLVQRTELGGDDRTAFRAALDELIEQHRFNADQPEGLLGLANIASVFGEIERAENYLRASIARHPDHAAAYVNLADLHRSSGSESQAADVLEAGVATLPGNADLRLALGYALVRSGRSSEALEHFEAAATQAADVPDFAYVFGVALNSLGYTNRALPILRSAHERFPGHRDLLYALSTVLRDEGRRDEALAYALRLTDLIPGDRNARALVEELSNRPLD